MVKLTDGTLLKCEDGFGCHTFTSGTAVFGTTITGSERRIDGSLSIDRLATDDEVTDYNNARQ